MMHIRRQKAIDSINVLLMTVSLLSLPIYNSAYAEPISKEHVSVLERIGHEYAANRERIRTWRGKVEFSQKVSTAGAESLQEVEKATIRFVYDGEKQHWLSVYEQTWLPEQTKELLLQSAMLADDAYYLYNSYSPEHFPSRFLPYLMIYPVAEGQKSNVKRAGDFRPLDMSTAGGDVSGLMLGYAKLLQEGKDLTKRRTLSRTGNIVKVRIELGNVVSEYVFDLDMASSLVQFVSTGSDPSIVWKCQMDNVNGVFVPRELTRDEVRGKKRLVQKMRWFDQVVNEPISKDEFTIANLGVHRTDRVKDHRTGAEYELTDAKLLPRTTPGIARELRQTSKRPPYLIVVSLFFLATTVALIIYRRYRNAKARG